jgi:hypothetical protein
MPSRQPAPSRTTLTPRRGHERRRKNVRIDQRKLDAARRILRTTTETETIEQALDLVVLQERAGAGMARMVGRGGFRSDLDSSAR